MRRAGILLAFMMVAAVAPGDTQVEAPRDTTASVDTARSVLGWALPDTGYVWSFPRDHWAHPEYRNEWWYVTGQLAANDGQHPRYGYQFTLFRIGLLPAVPALQSDWATRGMVMGHLAVTDLVQKTHVFSEVLMREMPLLGGFSDFPLEPIAWSRAPTGTHGTWEFRALPDSGFVVRAIDRSHDIALDLVLHPERGPILQGPQGLSVKNASGKAASLYYSMTRLRTEGSLRSEGKTARVSGLSWLDREWSSVGLGGEQAGWDWFSLQLRDGRDLMLYRLRGKRGDDDFGRATLVSASGKPSYLDFDDWSLTPGRVWTSPETGAEYPVNWTILVYSAGLALDVEPLVEGSENVGERSGIAYWEGPIVARDKDGREAGRGYLELTGYGGKKARPEL